MDTLPGLATLRVVEEKQDQDEEDEEEENEVKGQVPPAESSNHQQAGGRTHFLVQLKSQKFRTARGRRSKVKCLLPLWSFVEEEAPPTFHGRILQPSKDDKRFQKVFRRISLWKVPGDSRRFSEVFQRLPGGFQKVLEGPRRVQKILEGPRRFSEGSDSSQSTLLHELAPL